MPRDVKIGTGIDEKRSVRLDLSASGPTEDSILFIEWAKAIESPDDVRENAAQVVRTHLIARGHPDPDAREYFGQPSQYTKYGEDSVDYFFAQWLFEYRRVSKFRDDVETGKNPRSLPHLVDCAIALGRLEGRFGFLNQRDPQTKRLWKDMAASSKEHHLKSEYGLNVAKEGSFDAKHGDELVALADDYFTRKPNARDSEFFANVRSCFVNTDRKKEKDKKDKFYDARTLRRALEARNYVRPPS